MNLEELRKQVSGAEGLAQRLQNCSAEDLDVLVSDVLTSKDTWSALHEMVLSEYKRRNLYRGRGA